MGRPKKCRWVETEPGVTYFKPRGIPLRSLQQIVITVDELEAMRLADFLEMTQEEVAQQMQVSRPTVTRMLSRAPRPWLAFSQVLPSSVDLYTPLLNMLT